MDSARRKRAATSDKQGGTTSHNIDMIFNPDKIPQYLKDAKKAKMMIREINHPKVVSLDKQCFKKQGTYST